VKVIDRFTGVTTTLPPVVEPALSIGQGDLTNGDIRLEDGEILFSDGSDMRSATRHQFHPRHPHRQRRIRPLISRSIGFLARLAKSQPATTISPLILPLWPIWQS
jgi:hypothetical protein